MVKRSEQVNLNEDLLSVNLMDIYLEGKNKIQKQPSRGVLKKGVPKICSKFTGGNPCQSVISIKSQSNFIEITLLHGCSPVSLLIFRTPFYKNSYEELGLKI